MSLNRPFKSVLTECWEDYVLKLVNGVESADLNDPNFKLSAPSRQDIVDWVQKDYEYLVLKKEMVRKGFEVCGVTSAEPSKVRNDQFHKNIMTKVVDELQTWEMETLNDDPFAEESSIIAEIYYSRIITRRTYSLYHIT